jgi:arylsulfatase A-like enzyme
MVTGLKVALTVALAAFVLPANAAERARPNNVILFVADGMRALSVTQESAPTLAEVRDKGVNFKNSHSLFPTFTTANASAMATGHYFGDTGNYSNTIYTGRAIESYGGSVTPRLDDNDVLGEINRFLGGNYLNEDTILKAARARGFSTAAIGKSGAALIFDSTERSGEHTILIDDATGTQKGIPLSAEVKAALQAAGLPLATPSRGANAQSGDFKTPGSTVANVVQQSYFADVTTKVLLPLLKARNKPFLLVYWSLDPDGTQHGQGDSHLTLTPGINGPTSRAAIKNADENLKQIRATLGELGLSSSTNLLITADHGFATISKESATSPSAKVSYPDVPPGFMPRGFLAFDLAKALNLPMFDPNNNNARVAENATSRDGNALIGNDPSKPDVVVASNSASNLIYLPGKDRKLAGRIVDALLAQDYTSGVFVDDDLGPFPGTLPASAVNLVGRAVTPRPSIVVNFRSYSTGCDEPLLCAAIVADSRYQQGQGSHGGLSRAETMNFMAAIGPDFKTAFVDEAPVSNADVGQTIAKLLGLQMRNKGRLTGRTMSEAMPGGAMPRVRAHIRRSTPSAGGLRTVLNYQTVGKTRYFDAAGFPGRTLGLIDKPKAAERR